MAPRYEVLSHTADTGIVASGATLTEVFENAAFAMFDLMFGIGDLVGADRVRIEADGYSVEDLLVDWLSTLLFEAETRDLALCSFSIETMTEGHVEGSAVGISSADLELKGPPMKAITYHELSIDETPCGYSARIIFDV